MFITEFNANGSIDTSFGTTGTATSTTITSDNSGVILNLQANGQIVAGAAGVSGNFELVRFNGNGSVDTTFGSSGVETGAAVGNGEAMVTAANGETVMIGTPSSGSGIILQEFHTLAKTFTYYIEYDADYNVTSLADTSGGA